MRDGSRDVIALGQVDCMLSVVPQFCCVRFKPLHKILGLYGMNRIGILEEEALCMEFIKSSHEQLFNGMVVDKPLSASLQEFVLETYNEKEIWNFHPIHHETKVECKSN